MERSELRAELDALAEQISETVAERRRRGDYPVGLEAELERHFNLHVRQRRSSDVDVSPVRTATHEAVSLPVFHANAIEVGSGIPGGSAIHRTVAKVVSRQSGGILQQVQTWRSAVETSLHSIAETLDGFADHDHPQVADSISLALDRIAVIDQLELIVHELEQRVDRLEARVDAAFPRD